MITMHITLKIIENIFHIAFKRKDQMQRAALLMGRDLKLRISEVKDGIVDG